MKTINYRKQVFTLAILLFGFGVPALAEDTEVYIGNTNTNGSQANVYPNLVFIIDTSGSMSGNVTVRSNDTYDPSTTYTGTCAADRIYWSSDGRPPTCSTSNYFAATSNHCAASATALATGGVGSYLTLKSARYRSFWRGDRWANFSTNDHDDIIECKDDYGVHGENSTTNNKYPADEDNGGPWRNTSASALNWANAGKSYTLYNANYLNWRNSPAAASTTKTRLQIVQEVFSDLMDRVSNINIAVMRFDNKSQELNQGGYFAMPMQLLSDSNRASYKAAVNAFTTGGYTPLSETLYESYLYYKGANVKYGGSTTPATNDVGVLENGAYKSPIEFQCQKNFVILLTDGAPTYDTTADSDIEALPGFSAVNGGSASCSGNCLDELADYMYTKDCSTLDDKQNVITYTIGFNTDQALLSQAATKGGGEYYQASDTSGLTDVFTSILTEILAVNDTFIAPAVSVNAFNRFKHRDELYYALFRPNPRPKWDGNVKRYRLFGNPPEIVDVNNVAAIDPNTGFFKKSSRSYWTPDADSPAGSPEGDEVRIGGAASKLALPRTIYTWTAAGEPNNSAIITTANALSETNTAITATMLGDVNMTATDRTDLLTWSKGVDILDSDADGAIDDARRFISDPLHAKPLLVTYGGTDAAPDITLFSGTNEGHLTAINTTNGTEVFTFVPKELLPNLMPLFVNSGNTDHKYGMDGPLTSWINDANNNRVLLDTDGTLETGEFAYLYQAMRRGGRHYYAFDVSNRSAPLLKWVIRGGSADFSELGQTWSAAKKARIKLNGSPRDVLIFGGGYDVDQDDLTAHAVDDIGRAIYMVDANTGAKLWQAGPAGSNNGSAPDLVLAGMTNSIPSDVSLLDTDLDGFTDRLYVGDMRGQVWRLDFNVANTGAATFATGGVIASLGGSTAAENRRFYYAPGVSLSTHRTHLNIAIGSGFRAHPLATNTENAFFIIKDKNVYSPALDTDGNPQYTALTLSNLYDATENVLGQGTGTDLTDAQTALRDSDGYYISLNKSDGTYVGEKVLAKSLTFSGILMFTTYTPVASASNACSPSQGAARIYLVNISDGTPLFDTNASGGENSRDDRSYDLVRGGIPPEPSIILHDSGPVLIVGTEVLSGGGSPPGPPGPPGPPINFKFGPEKTRWINK